MRVLYVTSEVFPLIKTGGLADVSNALPHALRARGVDVRIVVPAYPQAIARAQNVREYMRLDEPIGGEPKRLLEAHLPGSDIPVWLVDCPVLYNRTGGPYSDDTGVEWADNHLRFAWLARAAAALSRGHDRRWIPDVIHANDWHSGLVSSYLASNSAKRIPIVFTIHNLAYQGLFESDKLSALNLPAAAAQSLEFHGRLSFLKAGIHGADVVTTVSPTYAKEILTPEYGCGLDRLLHERASRLIGILNGMDSNLWDPTQDSYLTVNYSGQAISGKSACKQVIQKQLGLAQSCNTPLVAFMSRLSHQKMPDVVLEAFSALMQMDLQFALLAEGDAAHEAAFRELADRHPGRVAVQIGYDEATAHRLLAGADILLHPSRYEPCGLVPLYAMRYGAVPVVRRCGGLADSVVETLSDTIAAGTATGFMFDDATATSLVGSVAMALSAYRQPLLWRKIRAAGMARDFSWDGAAAAYEAVYRTLVDADADGNEMLSRTPGMVETNSGRRFQVA